MPRVMRTAYFRWFNAPREQGMAAPAERALTYMRAPPVEQIGALEPCLTTLAASCNSALITLIALPRLIPSGLAVPISRSAIHGMADQGSEAGQPRCEAIASKACSVPLNEVDRMAWYLYGVWAWRWGIIHLLSHYRAWRDEAGNFAGTLEGEMDHLWTCVVEDGSEAVTCYVNVQHPDVSWSYGR